MQEDRGSFDPENNLALGSHTPGASYDGIGDKCQCGDGNGDGKITNAGGSESDLSNLRRYLLGDNAHGLDSAARCNLKNDTADTGEKCNLLDAMVLKRALETASSETNVPLPDPPLCAAANPQLPAP